MAAGGRHPHFISPLGWHASLADGLSAARESGRAVLLVVGRQACGGTRALVEKTMAKEEIHEYLDAHYVCVAGDADAPEPAVAALVSRMTHHDRTPLCLYVSSEEQLMHSTSGGRPPAVFLSDLLEAPHRTR
jgi:thioredoxin-related protein